MTPKVIPPLFVEEKSEASLGDAIRQPSWLWASETECGGEDHSDSSAQELETSSPMSKATDRATVEVYGLVEKVPRSFLLDDA